MDLDMISAMKVKELKNLLHLRGLKLSVRKQELAARVFVATENDVPIIKTSEEVESEIRCQLSSEVDCRSTLRICHACHINFSICSFHVIVKRSYRIKNSKNSSICFRQNCLTGERILLFCLRCSSYQAFLRLFSKVT